jgi:uroporphyrinogen decarboxylase
MLRNIPQTHPRPDIGRFLDVLAGRRAGTRPPLVEYLVDESVKKTIVTELLGRTWADFGPDRDMLRDWLDNFILFWRSLGYDFVRFEASLPFPENKLTTADTSPFSAKARTWADEHRGRITTRHDFETYPWPEVKDFDFFPYEYLDRHMPEGMGLLVSHGGGLFEHLSWIMSFEGLCLALAEDPELVEMVASRLGGLITDFNRHLLGLDTVAAFFPGDDMGFRSGPLVAPRIIKELVLPWHKRWAAMAHARGRPYFLHSCGNLELLMDDLIDDVRIDGKHSFEDAILPVEDFQARYGQRLAVLGGVDLNILANGSAEDVRHRTRALIEVCGAKGRFAVGSGNSIPSYVPPANYLAMVDEALG